MTWPPKTLPADLRADAAERVDLERLEIGDLRTELSS
jgi:hypothetical protein